MMKFPGDETNIARREADTIYDALLKHREDLMFDAISKALAHAGADMAHIVEHRTRDELIYELESVEGWFKSTVLLYIQ